MNQFCKKTVAYESMRRALLCLALLWMSISGSAMAHADAESWVMIDTASQTLAVFQDNQVKQIFHNISVGRNGYTFDRHEGDGKTPLGVFHIAWINPNSRFHLFFGLDYPNQEMAEAAFRSKVIDFDSYFAIRKALYHRELPPQNTPLGGHIGIHGIGHGNHLIHETANWTQGCIALTNEQIEQLAQWIALGTKVVIY